jgi:hypothetical protein
MATSPAPTRCAAVPARVVPDAWVRLVAGPPDVVDDGIEGIEGIEGIDGSDGSDGPEVAEDGAEGAALGAPFVAPAGTFVPQMSQ